MGSLPRAILLDLDDTILDDSGGVIACWRDACLAHRSSMKGLDADTVFEAIDRTREWYWSDPERHRVGRLELAWARGEVVRLALAELGVDDEGLARQIGDTYHALRDDAIKPFDDAVPTVQWLRAQELGMGRQRVRARSPRSGHLFRQLWSADHPHSDPRRRAGLRSGRAVTGNVSNECARRRQERCDDRSAMTATSGQVLDRWLFHVRRLASDALRVVVTGWMQD
jgi:hypothetical protein